MTYQLVRTLVYTYANVQAANADMANWKAPATGLMTPNNGLIIASSCTPLLSVGVPAVPTVSAPAENDEPSANPRPSTSPGWEIVDSIKVKWGEGGMTKWTYVGEPVRVLGLGKRTQAHPEGSIQPGWRISLIERRAHAGAYEYNVTVVKGLTSRIVKGDKLYYVKPKAKA